MYKAILITIGLALSTGSLRAATAADSSVFVYGHEPVAPVAPDAELLKAFKAQKALDYYRRAPAAKGISLGERIRRLLGDMFDVDITEGQATLFMWVVLGLAAAGMVWLLVKYRPQLFFRNRKTAPVYTLGDNDALPSDFDRLIAAALTAGHYADAVRYRYLHTLKVLDAAQLIAWNVHRTAGEYVASFPRKDLLPPFARLSQLFLYARYGHFDTLRRDYDEAEQLARQITGGLQ